VALNLSQWYAKITKFVPSWYFERKDVSGALSPGVFKAIASVFQQLQQDTDDQQASTFITESAAPVLDLLGDERNTPRTLGESDISYAPRVQLALFVPVGESQLQMGVDGLLNNGTAFFIENEQYGFWDDPDTSEDEGFLYYDDDYSRWLELTKWYNWWTLIIPGQTAGDVTAILASVISFIEANKALGTTYDVLYDSDFLVEEDGGSILQEDGTKIDLET
jgi:hypothetical protein